MYTSIAFTQILMMMMVASVGFFLRKIKAFSDSLLAGTTWLLISVAQPAMMITSTQQPHTAQAVADYLIMTGVTTLILMAGMLLINALARRLDKDARPVLVTASMLSNVGYMGIPIVQAVLGDQGVFFMSSYVIALNLAQWTVGVAVYSGVNFKSLKNLINPIFIAAVVGLMMFILDIRLPELVGKALLQFNNLNTPLSMMILGARLAALRLPHLLDRKMWLSVALKLFVLPLVLFYGLRWTGLPETLVLVMALGSAMPTGVNVQLQAEKNQADTAFAAKCISVSTLLSVGTIPVILSIIAR